MGLLRLVDHITAFGYPKALNVKLLLCLRLEIKCVQTKKTATVMMDVMRIKGNV